MTIAAGRLALVLAAAACAGRDADVNLRSLERQVFRLVNEERLRAGLGSLQWDDCLAAEARRHSYNMVARWFFAHEDPARGGLAKRLKNDKVPWRDCAENIFNEQGHRNPAGVALRSWLNSPGHRANMLDPRFTHTGVGAARRVDGTVFVTQNFIRP